MYIFLESFSVAEEMPQLPHHFPPDESALQYSVPAPTPLGAACGLAHPGCRRTGPCCALLGFLQNKHLTAFLLIIMLSEHWKLEQHRKSFDEIT